MSLIAIVPRSNALAISMDRATRDCLVTGYGALIPAIELPDPDDRHVFAAAIVGRCDVIVTWNLQDFPFKALDPSAAKSNVPTNSSMAT